ncbi:MAG: hypothetical protein KW793_04765 [Candidatus Doudnabacteria bacterium]|nr:hypothetical protein [Candidatus Doudnabacteria bacterium]
MKTEPITVRDGKIFNGDIEVLPEIGNAQHIKALGHYQRRAGWLQQGVELMFWTGDYDDEMKAGLDCLCGHQTEWKKTMNNYEDESHFAKWLMQKKTFQCKCNRKYKFYHAEFGIGIKLTKIR